MKSKLFVLLFIIAAAISTAYSQRTEREKYPGDMITINPLKFFVFYNLTYYHRITPHIAIGGGFQIPSISAFSGFGINLEMRNYIQPKTLKGFYIAPNASYNSLTSGETVSVFSFGLLVGWQWFIEDEFAIGVGIGVDYYTGGFSAGDFGRYNGTLPSLRFDIGYGW